MNKVIAILKAAIINSTFINSLLECICVCPIFFFNLSTKCKPIGKLQISIYVVCWICSRCYFSESNKELHRPMTSDGIFRCLARMFFVCVLCVIIGQPRDLLYSLSYSLNVNTCGFTAISQLYSVFHIVVDWMAICWIDWIVNWYRHGSATHAHLQNNTKTQHKRYI